MLRRIALLLGIGLWSAAATAEGRTDNLVAEHGTWAVYVETDPVECFAVAKALDGPLVGSLIAPGLLVAIWPGRGGVPEFSFATEGPSLAPGTEFAVDTGTVWPLLPEGAWAWPADPASDAAIAAALPGAVEVTISGRLATGKGFAARFSLDGYVAALAQAVQLCGSVKAS